MLPYFEKADYYYMQHPYLIRGPITHSSVSAYVCRVSHPAEKGEFERSLEAFAPIIPHTVNSMNGYFYGMDSLGWAEMYYFKGDMNNTEKFARQAVYQAHEKNQYEIEYRALYFLLRMSLGNGDYPAVQELLRKIEDQLEITEYVNRYTVYYMGSGWFYAQIGATEKLESWLKGDFEENELNTMLHGFEILVKAKCAFADKQYRSAVDTLNEHQENKYGLGNFLLGRIEMTLLQAVSLYRLWDAGAAAGTPAGAEDPAASAKSGPAEAVRKLEAAYDMARPNALDMPFIELGEAMRDLLSAALNDTTSIPRPWLEMIRSKASVYGKKLSLVAEQFRNQGGYRAEGPQASGPAPALTWREREVLIGLSRGLTREGIAGNLAVSVNTVKADIGSLYAKIGARNRADAIRIAANLRIFSR
jgi:ATP/maltotriose-dependent transcriptional regulator MalT